VAHWISELLGSSGWLTLLAGIALLFLALRFLVGVLKDLLTARAEQMLDRTLLRSPLAAIGAGLAITAMVQSSSITTSVMVPLVAAGIVSLEQLFPLTIGANLGTTVTAMLAALSTGNAAAISVALSHVLFNATGAVVLYPIPIVRRIPLVLARGLGSVASRHRWLALLYVAFVFFGVPLLMLAVAGRF
jgi:sodium-dependent phosphate cotransporter